MTEQVYFDMEAGRFRYRDGTNYLGSIYQRFSDNTFWDENPFPSEIATETLLSERQKTHGDFERNARISQTLKTALQEDQPMRSNVHQEALDMICLKLSRIASGQADFRDHWDDIAGYATLAAKACTK